MGVWEFRMLCLLLMATVWASSAGAGELIGYGPARGYLTVPEKTPAPAILMIHEWWGLNDQVKREADHYAAGGFVVLAVDLYAGKVATAPEQAVALKNGLSDEAARANLQAAFDFLAHHPKVRPDRIASLGWCMGGGYSVSHTLDNPKLAACVVYYGRLVDNPELLKKTTAPIIGVFGNDDKNPSPEMVQGFETALQQVGREYRIYRYAGAGHAFANPSGGERYRPEAAADANARVLAFLREKLMR